MAGTPAAIARALIDGRNADAFKTTLKVIERQLECALVLAPPMRSFHERGSTSVMFDT